MQGKNYNNDKLFPRNPTVTHPISPLYRIERGNQAFDMAVLRSGAELLLPLCRGERETERVSRDSRDGIFFKNIICTVMFENIYFANRASSLYILSVSISVHLWL